MLTNGAARSRTLIVDQADDELLAGAAFAVDENRGVEWRDAGRQFQHILHRLAAGDEVLRGRVPVDALTQQVQLTFTAFQEPFAPVQFLDAFAHRLVQTLDFMADRRRLKICANQVEVSAPTLCVAPDGHTVLVRPVPRTTSRENRSPSPGTR